MSYIWQRKEWPNFSWDSQAVDRNAYAYALEASGLVGELRHLPEDLKTDVLIDRVVSEAVKTSQIEGEHYDRQDVRSSIRNQLGLNATPETVQDPRANGVAALMISVRDHFSEPLTAEHLCEWQGKIIVRDYRRADSDVGRWRTGAEPMQIVSGAIGRQRVHYEAPPTERVPAEMTRFIEWFNGSRDLKAAIRAGVGHLYFECIHPFADGNGRIGRAISEIALSQELGHPALLSLSTTIQSHRSDYYEALSKASQGGLDITEWLLWFSALVLEAQQQAKEKIAFVIVKAGFWGTFSKQLNARQTKVLNRMLRTDPADFEGGMSSRKYIGIAGCSKATATRDLAELLRIGAIRKLEGSGRSTRYEVVLI